MKTIIDTKNAPAAIGPYVQAVSADGLIFTSGQLGIDPITGKLPESVEEQTQQSLNNIKAILKEAGCSMDDVVKTTVFVTDLSSFASVNAIYAENFGSCFPARSCIQVAALPLNGLVEIEVVARCR
ncbi:MAG: RidA family protein [Lachnospiraceae bacterium]